MSREIKFRAWSRKDGTMRVVAQLLDGARRLRIVGFEGTIETSLAEDVELMQYTGLRDKNGRELYEGDIVTDGYREKYGRYDVEWDGDSHAWSFCSTDGRELEVIGNIYENPELLAPPELFSGATEESPKT